MLTNRNEDLLRAEFKRRYLVEFTGYVNGLMERSQSEGMTFLFLFVALFLGSANPALAVLLGGGLLTRRLQVDGDVKAALSNAARQIAADLQSGERTLPSVERWLDQHIDNLPLYLDKLDRMEEEIRRERSLIQRINRAGSAEAVTVEDRAFLKRRGHRKLTPPLVANYPLPPRVQLSNWHFSQLDRALWRDIGKHAGGRGRLWRRMLGLAKRAPDPVG
jgi:hypothetical protein